MIARALVLIGLLLGFVDVGLLSQSLAAESQRIVRLKSGRKTLIKVLFEGPVKARGAILLFPGGTGDVKINKDGLANYKENILFRIRKNLHKLGWLTAIASIPKDIFDTEQKYRYTNCHISDNKKVVDLLIKEAGIKNVFVIGHSRGSLSAAILLNTVPKIKAVIFSGSMVSEDRFRSELEKADKDKKIFLIHHKEDRCSASSYSMLKGWLKESQRMKNVPLKLITAGSTTSPALCKSESLHSFNGAEAEVAVIIDSILSGFVGDKK